MEKVRALRCGIFEDKSIGNCSNNGISNRYNDVYVLCPDGNIEIDLNDPPENLVSFEVRNLGFGKFARFTPYNNNGKWNMFGGTFVWSCDSRFREHFCEYPVPLHDRYE